MKKIITAVLLSVVMLAASFSFVPASLVQASTLTDGLVAHYGFDGNLNDSTSNANNGIQSGNIGFVKGVSGNAASFDGKSYIEVNPSTSLNLSSAFTISVWVYKNYDHSAGLMPIVQKDDSYSLCDYLMYPRFLFYSDASNYEKYECTHYVDIRKWELLTVTYGGGELKFSINGEQPKDVESISGSLPDSDGKLVIGKLFDSEKDQFFKGYMDDLRIYNRTLDMNEVKALYDETANGIDMKVVTHSNKLVAWYKFNGDTKDSSGFANDAKYVSPGRPVFTDAIQGKGLVFDGSSYLEVADNDPQELDKAFTVSAWVCEAPKSDINDDAYPILAKANCSLSPEIPAYQFQYRHLSGNNERIRFYGIDPGTSSPNNEIEEDFPSAYQVWKMITVTYKDGKTTAYVNGKQVGLPSDFPEPLLHSGGKLYIGRSAFRDEGNVVFKGSMDEVRFYNYALNATDVQKVYAYRDSIVVTPDTKALLALKSSTKHVLLKVSLVPPEKAPVTDITARVKYTLSNASVFTFMPKGSNNLTFKGPGKTNLTLTLGPLSTTVPIIVR